jgi:thioesterase domain-containing protein
MYGPTETTIWSAVKKVESGSPITIGRPIANTQFHVVDAHLQALPVGIPGELVIGGTGLARGYWQRPELTAEKFVHNPFSVDPESRLYRTGDRVRYLADGALEFLGRMDQQVKIRGFRIELGEIECSLRAHPAVRDAAVVVGDDATVGKQLIAYVVWSDGPRATTADLRDHLKGKLPAYMVPAVWVELAALPLTPNGKLDRKALPAPSQGTAARATVESKSSFGLPRDMLEVQLTQLWERVLGVRPIGRNDDFFDLGGHSFLAVRLFAGIEKLTGKRLPLATIFHASTIAALGEILRREGWTPNWSSLVPIQPGGTQAPLFLVHGAEGNVLLYRQLAQYLGPDQPVYGFQSQGLSGEQSAFLTCIEEMAARYVEELVALRPDGPYHLGGYCLGGVLAYEMAQQLRAMGREVGLVLLLETYNFNTVPSSTLRRRKPIYTLQKVWFHAANLRLAEGHDRWKFLREKRTVALARLEVQGRALYQGLSNPANAGTGHSYPHLLVKRANDEAVLQYVPRPYVGRVALFRPKSNFRGLDDPAYGWGGLVGGGLSTHVVPIYPRGMLVEPFVQTLAEQVKAALAKAR